MPLIILYDHSSQFACTGHRHLLYSCIIIKNEKMRKPRLTQQQKDEIKAQKKQERIDARNWRKCMKIWIAKGALIIE